MVYNVTEYKTVIESAGVCTGIGYGSTESKSLRSAIAQFEIRNIPVAPLGAKTAASVVAAIDTITTTVV